MAVSCDFNTSSRYRDLAMKKILKASSEKKWSLAENLTVDYLDYCRPYWEKYDTHLNFKSNKCGMCLKQKQSIVKPFYLIVNTDI